MSCCASSFIEPSLPLSIPKPNVTETTDLNRTYATLKAHATLAPPLTSGVRGLPCADRSSCHSSVAMPEMKQRGYAMHLCTGSVAAGAILGNLFRPPPQSSSTRSSWESIGRLYIAVLVPAAISIVLYAATIFIWLGLNPKVAPGRTPFDVKKFFRLCTRAKAFSCCSPRRTSVHPCGFAKDSAADYLPSTGALASDPRVQPLEPTSSVDTGISSMPAASSWLTYKGLETAVPELQGRAGAARTPLSHTHHLKPV
jgi:hypothetical protein